MAEKTPLERVEARLRGLNASYRIAFKPPVDTIGTYSKTVEVHREIVRLTRIRNKMWGQAPGFFDRPWTQP